MSGGFRANAFGAPPQQVCSQHRAYPTEAKQPGLHWQLKARGHSQIGLTNSDALFSGLSTWLYQGYVELSKRIASQSRAHKT